MQPQINQSFTNLKLQNCEKERPEPHARSPVSGYRYLKNNAAYDGSK